MALYLETATGFIGEYASNPGAGYSLISAQPTDTVANRAAWWRGIDLLGGQTSQWHPLTPYSGSLPEVPTVPGISGSGVNILPGQYTSFESDGGLPALAHTSMTAAQATGGYHGTKCLQLTTTANPGTTWLNASSSAYNVKMTANTRWIVSIYVAPTTSVARTFTLLVKTPIATYEIPLTSGAVANTFTRLSGALDLRVDNSATAVLGIRIDGTSVVLKVDALMMEEQIGAGTAPSAFEQPPATIDGSILDDGTVTSAKILSLSADKLTAGTINAGTITVINLNASNLTTGTINGSRFGTNTIGSGPVIGGALHKQYVLSGQSSSIPYIASSSINLASCHVAGPINLPSNSDRSGCVILVNAFFEWNTVSTAGWLVCGVMTGYRTGALLSRPCYWDNGRDVLSFMTFHNSGSAAQTYYLGIQQYIANPYSVNCYYDVCVLEFMK